VSELPKNKRKTAAIPAQSKLDWEHVNAWTCTLYTLVHSLAIAKQMQFGVISDLGKSLRSARSWVTPTCSYGSVLLLHPTKDREMGFRRNPNQYFSDVAEQVTRMLVQDLVVILDEMMSQILAARGEHAGDFPQSRVEKLAKGLDQKFLWSAHGCYEMIAVRNVFSHAEAKWNQRSIAIIPFISPAPKVGDKLTVGLPMLFYYRKAMRTFLSQVA
jgi:hypothetical protein